MEIFGESVFFLSFFFGTLWGSFLNVCIYRIPLEQNIAFPASRCTHCDHSIAWYDNIPLISWGLLLRGKCRHCQASISAIYPFVEAMTGLLTLQVVMVFGYSLESIALLVLGYAFIVLLMIDLYHYILPDVITLPGMLLGVILAALPQVSAPLASLPDSLLGLAVGGGGLWAFAWIFEKITGKVGMGFGDVKLLGLVGAWLGWQALPFTLFFAALMGSVVGLSWIGLLGRDRAKPIPFGPYLVLAAWFYLFVGESVYSWYLSTAYPGY
ncbi:MAG: prepilin peptidase [Magnetococcales bacterium]|nr:prepilin peptidase [Magnetococcales bacterium]